MVTDSTELREEGTMKNVKCKTDLTANKFSYSLHAVVVVVAFHPGGGI